MAWLDDARLRARTRLRQARDANRLPPFADDTDPGGATPVVMVDASPRIDDGIPRAVRVAGAWAWRVILFVADPG